MIKRYALILFGLLSLCGCFQGPQKDLFGIYSANLDGSDIRMIISDPSRQMTHARVSPDGQWIAFTRYNKKGFNGLAEEEGGYFETEIAVSRIDGSEIRTIIPPKKGVLAANANWSDDSKKLLYISTDNAEHSLELRLVDLQTLQVSQLDIPETLKPADPDWHENFLVFPSKGDGMDALWMMSFDGKIVRQLTSPSGFEGRSGTPFSYGDYDPKISPDGTKVAFMRYFGGEIWKSYVVDIATGAETLLSHGEGADVTPEWSSDGQLLAFWHIDRNNLPSMGIYTMRPDGTDRKMIPLQRGMLHGHPVFFPNSGSVGNARIMYVAKKFPLLP
jgi:Tol biopolymer transport system component